MNLRVQIREIVKSVLNEGKNPYEIIDFFLKNEPQLIQKLKNNDSALLKRLASLDIEFNPEKTEVGKIFPWLINLWKRNDPDLIELLKSAPNSEKVLKFKSAQQLFNKAAFKKSINITDINKFKSLSDFIKRTNEAFFEPEEIPSIASFGIDEINKDIKEGNIAKTNLSNDNFLVITPLKKKGACKYGNTHIGNDEGRWCTAKEEHNAFDSYKDGILYIFMDKKDNLKSKYQYYFKNESVQFNNEYNRPFNYREFFDNNVDIFKKLYPDVVTALETKSELKIPRYLIQMLPSNYFQIFLKNSELFMGSLLNDINKIIKGEKKAEDVFDKETIDLDYEDIEFRKDSIVIEIELSKVDDILPSFYWAERNGYDGYEFYSDEYDYIQNYVDNDDKQLFLKLIRFFKNDFSEINFDEEGKIFKVIKEKPAYNFFETLLDNFAANYQDAINEAQSQWIDETMRNLPMTVGNDFLILEYDEIIKFCLEKQKLNPTTLNEIIDDMLTEYSISEDNFYDHHNNNVNLSKLKSDLHDDLESAEEDIMENFEGVEVYIENQKKFAKIVKDLNFEEFGFYHQLKLEKENFSMIIIRKDFEEGKVYIKYLKKEPEEKEFEGWINIDDIPRYATMEMMLEGFYNLRRKIKKIIIENYYK